MARRKGSNGVQTAQRILDVSLPLFAQYGYAAVSMRQIADQVGVNVGAIYNHFPSKQQILVSHLSDHMKGLIGTWKEHDPRSDPLARLEAFIRFLIRFNLNRPDAVFISFMELRSLEPENHVYIEKMRRKYEHDLRDIIQSGMDQNIFKTGDAHVAAMSVFGSLIGLNTWFKEKGRLSKATIEDYYLALTLNALGYTDASTATAHTKFQIDRAENRASNSPKAQRSLVDETRVDSTPSVG